MKDSHKNTKIKILDITDFDAVKKVTKEIKDEFGYIDMLINAAGINIQNRDWDNINENDWDKVFKVNINGIFYCCKSVLSIMKEQKDGLITVSYTHLTLPTSDLV